MTTAIITAIMAFVSQHQGAISLSFAWLVRELVAIRNNGGLIPFLRSVLYGTPPK